MKRMIFILAVLMSATWVWAKQSTGPVKVIYPTRMAVSQPLREVAKPISSTSFGSQATETSGPAGPTVVDFAGLSIHENPTEVFPGDPTLALGPNDDLIQMVNTVFAVADRFGVVKVGPALISTLWTGLGGPCEFNDDGHPTVLYDPLADRWLMSQHVLGQSECIAISQGSDPTGSYFLYEFNTPGNDKPEVGVWSDAYYVGMRNLNTSGYDVYAFERDKMLIGDPSPQGVTFSLETLLPGADNFLPADLDGTTPPPAGAPGIFMGMDDPSIPQDHLVMFELNVDWNNTANSTLTGPTNIPVAQFDANMCNFNPNCIRQPNTTQRVDALSGMLMPRLAYRNFGSHAAMVANQTVDFGDFPDHAAIRWYEFRDTGSGWSVYQEGTYAPDTDHRWNGSIAMNGNGDIMLGYSVASGIAVPTIRYVGRQAGDPLGQMTLVEGILAESAASQVGESSWGAHSSTVVDPADDFSFWHTNYWIEGPNEDWHTWIGKFQATTDPPNFVITVTPQNPPIVIPAGGGSFTYDVTIARAGGWGGIYTVDIWNLIDLPGGGSFGPTIGPVRQKFFSGQVLTKTGIVQNIPGGAAPGAYALSFNAGRYATNPLSRNIMATDNFTFTKSAGPSAKIGSNAEVVTNWDTNWNDGTVKAEVAPETFALEQNYPNPFNPTTVIRYSLNEDAPVKLTIYNTLGQEVATLVDEVQKAGFKSVNWNGTNNLGQLVSAGVYLYKLEAGNNVDIKKMTFMK